MSPSLLQRVTEAARTTGRPPAAEPRQPGREPTRFRRQLAAVRASLQVSRQR